MSCAVHFCSSCCTMPEDTGLQGAVHEFCDLGDSASNKSNFCVAVKKNCVCNDPDSRPLKVCTCSG